MGMLGCPFAMEKTLRGCQKVDLLEFKATEYLMPLAWMPELPRFFNNFCRFLMPCATPHPTLEGLFVVPSCPKGFMEKTQMSWVRYNTIRAAAESAPVTEATPGGGTTIHVIPDRTSIVGFACGLGTRSTGTVATLFFEVVCAFG
jgi:hypothetical protein